MSNLITASDEKYRCCYLQDGDINKRCTQRSRFVAYGTPYSWDDYTHLCGDHMQEMRRPTDKVYKLLEDGSPGEEVK